MNKPFIPAELTHRLKVERKRLGKSQGQIADLCGSSREMWGRYERGTYPISAAVLRAFIECGADAEYLRTGIRSSSAPKPATATIPDMHPSAPSLNMADALPGNLPTNAVDMALQVLQAALVGGQQAGNPDGSTLAHLSALEYELVQAYRQASPERKEVFHDLVTAQKRRAAL